MTDSASSTLGPVIAVVGPSGVGKDSVMTGLATGDPRLSLLKRVITRAPEAGGEDYTPVSEAEFAARSAAGEFALHWQAHGLFYGVPAAAVAAQRAEGRGVLVNFSRSVLLDAQRIFGNFIVLSVTASPEVLAARLAGRGRETEEEQAKRLAQATKALPEGLERVYQIDNSGDLSAAVTAALNVIFADQPESA
ncbi:phosphonate metabolism protein/1,5-bisphosphokinase (PRPP-forming) PhnN [Epibacterium ulvae]|uniref:phosphonate metabolism protein/1,5-bisphosphokinase (PRPP-forming) PhnN n=1 Tax=Epibacterium ulvae TaxID=1156985 RepID=UPI001BFC70AB|nr:phosphonate metabolism protein/1,5-bisphosphokinase (PRPP-forming) PhnN [Epibacterium ulvae]MBT8154005.1 phosphonate metabolism protein/1,5-bisphosphokinase (PRPP-forming) PhnN [Epibacterium ulvae]